MKNQFLYILFGIVFFIFPNIHFGQAPNLRSTVSFALFTAAGALDNVGTSSIKGDIGSKTYTTTGFPPGVISGNIYNASDAQSTLAAADVALLYADLNRTPTSVIASSLGGQTLTAGIHSTGSGAAATLNGNITLNAQGNPDALFIIQIDGALIVSGSSNVILINSASPNNVFWQINGAISIGISSVFRGTIVSAGAISLLSNATLIGKGLSKAGAIALNTNIVITKLNPAAPTVTITQPTCSVSTGSITITAPVEIGMTYSMDGLDFTNTTGIFSAIPQGTYNVTAKDVDGFISAITIVTINTQPPTPNAPMIGAITQPSCTISTGSVILSGLPTGNWTINPGAITGTGTTTTINNLLAGTYNYTVTNADGCTSLASANVIMNVDPNMPAAFVGANQAICINTNTFIGTTAKTGNTYKWSSTPNGYISLIANPTVAPKMNTTYTLVETETASGCFNSNTVTITVKPLPANAGAISGITSICKGKTGIIYTVNPIADASGYIWTLPVGATITAGANTNSITVRYDSVALSGTITVKGTNSCGVGVASALAILVSDCSLADLSVITSASNMAPFIGRTINLTIVATNLGPYDATGVTVAYSLLNGYTYLSSSSANYDPFDGIWTIGNLKNGASANLSILVKINSIGNYLNTAVIAGNELDNNMANNISTVKPIPTDFFIPEGFSPNGDGINDLFVIRGIQYFPNNHFTIFNRWGNKVFETNQYYNTWNGKSTMGLRIGGDDLPTGTYFYLLDLRDGSEIFKGTIYLNR